MRESTESFLSFEIDIDSGFIVGINDKVLSHLGYKLEDVKGQKFSELMIPLSEKHRVERFLNSLDERPTGTSIRLLHANGRYESFLILVNKSPTEKTETITIDCIPEFERKTDVIDSEKSFFEIEKRNQILQVFLTKEENEEEVFADVLDIILSTTNSEFGYFGYIDDDGSLVCPSMTRNIWNRCEVPDKKIIFHQEQWGGIWKDSLLEKKVIVKNEENSIPDGHLPMKRSVAVPIIFHDEVIGQITVANKSTDYSEYDIHLLTKFADMIAPILNSRREIRRSQDALQESESQLQLIAENAQDLIYRIRLVPEMKFEYVSPSSTEMVGYTPQDHYDNPMLGMEIVHPEDRDKLERLAKEVPFDPLIIRWIHKNGKVIWIEQNNSPIYDESGNLIGIEGIARNITDRKKADDELKEKKLFSDQLFLAANSVLEHSDFESIAQVIFEACKVVTGAMLGNVMLSVEESMKKDRYLVRRGENTSIISFEKFIKIEKVRKKLYIQQEAIYENNLQNSEYNESFLVKCAELENVLIIPVILEGETQGIIALGNKPGEFTKDDVEKGLTFANLAAIALERMKTLNALEKTNKSLQRRSSELQMLYSLSQEVSKTVSYDEVMPIVHRHINRAFPHDISASLFILEDQQFMMINPIHPISSEVEQKIKRILRENYLKFRDEIGEELPEKPFAHIRMNPPLFEKKETISDLRSLISSPIIFPESRDVIGLVLLAAEQKGKFSEEDIRLLFTSMNQTSMVLQKLQALRTAEKERLASLIEHLPEGVILIDADERILVQNNTAREYLDDIGTIREDSSLSALGETPIQDILSFNDDRIIEIKKPDSEKIFEVVATSIKTGPQKGGWALVIEDVTIMREIQERVNTQERLASVGQLAAGLAHDFSNILQGIMGFAELLQMNQSLSEPITKDLSSIQSLAEKGSDLTKQLLDFSRQSVSEKRIVNLREVVDEILNLLKTSIPSNIRVLTEFEVGNYQVLADPTQIHQILMNLSINARDAMLDGGKLIIRLSNSEQNPEETNHTADEWIQLEIIDTGTGIEDSVLPHIFEPFFTTKDRTEGSGLGLAQVYGIVQQHNGTITVKTELGKGTNFTIYLPVHHKETVEKKVVSTKTTDYDGVSILVVDDEPIVLEALSRMLERLGCRTYTATNGRKALEIYQKERDNIDIILTDMMMPDMDGIELVKQLAVINPSAKVILMTGYPLGSKIEELKGLGLVSWAQKPLRLSRIGKLIQKYIDT
ncbi:MAG: GAF domain-containing protein [Candidatus Lokiarchaeota archaeon]|nr:GAF domain-containing protein [Candidatus Lokiarchaeota archaeon]